MTDSQKIENRISAADANKKYKEVGLKGLQEIRDFNAIYQKIRDDVHLGETRIYPGAYQTFSLPSNLKKLCETLNTDGFDLFVGAHYCNDGTVCIWGIENFSMDSIEKIRHITRDTVILIRWGD